MRKKFFWLPLAIIVFLLITYFVYLTARYYIKIQRGDLLDLGQGSFSQIEVTGGGQKKIVDASELKGENSPSIGNVDAKLQIVEFLDFTCPFSKQAFFVMRELVTRYPERMNLTIRYFPLQDEAHKGGLEAAIGAVCAQKQGKFWAYHDKLFQNQKNFTKEDLAAYSGQIGLDVPSFTKCLESDEARKKVENDWSDGYSLGLRGTPTFFVKNQRIEGAAPLNAWEKTIIKQSTK